MSLQPEQIDHINLVNWFNHEFPQYEQDLHHFANERKCSINQGRILKKMGVKKGVADFFLAVSMNGKNGMWLELKVGKGKLSPEQQEFLSRKISRGYEAIAAWGFESAKNFILTYLKEAPRG